MSLPPNGLIAPHCAPCIQPPLPPQQPGLPGLDMSHPNPRGTHPNNTQNVEPPTQPFLNSQISSWDCIWPLLIPPPPDRSSQHSSAAQDTQATSACPTCSTHPTSGPVQFGGGRPAPVVQDPTATLAAASSSSSSCPNPTAPHTAPPVPEAPLFRPGVAGPTTANANARRPKRVRPRRAREVPFVRVEDRIEWVSRDVMKMTLWFNWSPNAEDEAHEAWE